MGKMMLKIALLAALALVVLPLTAQAVPISWTFSVPNGSVASPQPYLDTSSTYTIVANGYQTPEKAPLPGAVALGQTWGDQGLGTFDFNTGTVASHALYGKTEGATETGLGMDQPAHQEVDENSFIQLDVSGINKILTALTMNIASVQDGEGFFIWASNVLGTPGELLVKGDNPDTGGDVQGLTLPEWGSWTYYSLSASNHTDLTPESDVLIQDGAGSAGVAVPEPATLSLLGLGAMGLIARLRRRS